MRSLPLLLTFGVWQAQVDGIRIFTADIIYHLFDQFTTYLKEINGRRREDAKDKVR
jgi:translation initiation factor 5B